jgi:hypothetical protein
VGTVGSVGRVGNVGLVVGSLGFCDGTGSVGLVGLVGVVGVVGLVGFVGVSESITVSLASIGVSSWVALGPSPDAPSRWSPRSSAHDGSSTQPLPSLPPPDRGQWDERRRVMPATRPADADAAPAAGLMNAPVPYQPLSDPGTVCCPEHEVHRRRGVEHDHRESLSARTISADEGRNWSP